MCLQESPPHVCRFFFKYFQICHWTFTEICIQKSPTPQFADVFFFKSAAGHLLKCACKPPACSFFFKSFQIWHWTFTEICILQKFSPLQIADCLKSGTGHFLICAYRNFPPPSLQIFSKLPLDIYGRLHAEPPQFANFFKSATAHLLMCAILGFDCRENIQDGQTGK